MWPPVMQKEGMNSVMRSWVSFSTYPLLIVSSQSRGQRYRTSLSPCSMQAESTQQARALNKGMTEHSADCGVFSTRLNSGELILQQRYREGAPIPRRLRQRVGGGGIELDDRQHAIGRRWWFVEDPGQGRGRKEQANAWRGGRKMRRKLILLRQVISTTLQPACPHARLRIVLPSFPQLPHVFLLRAPPQGSCKHWPRAPGIFSRSHVLPDVICPV
ncbi:hypothetical protein VTI74DRAFT_5084 [Chaetomium olivicolor]